MEIEGLVAVVDISGVSLDSLWGAIMTHGGFIPSAKGDRKATTETLTAPAARIGDGDSHPFGGSRILGGGPITDSGISTPRRGQG